MWSFVLFYRKRQLSVYCAITAIALACVARSIGADNKGGAQWPLIWDSEGKVVNAYVGDTKTDFSFTFTNASSNT